MSALGVSLAAGGLMGCRCASQRTLGAEQAHSSGIKQRIERIISPSLVHRASAVRVPPVSAQQRIVCDGIGAGTVIGVTVDGGPWFGGGVRQRLTPQARDAARAV